MNSEQTEERKIQLANHKIELNAVGILKSAIKSGTQAMKTFDKQKAKITPALRKAEDIVRDLQGAYITMADDAKDIKNTLDEVEQLAKQLGISPKEIEGYGDASIVEGDLRSRLDMDVKAIYLAVLKAISSIR